MSKISGTILAASSLMLAISAQAEGRLESVRPAAPNGDELATAPLNALGTKYGVRYGKPFIDISEDRQSPRPHRYVHGGFEGSHLRFSVYLPPRVIYKKRFLLIMEGAQGGLDKMLAEEGRYGWAFDVAFDDLGAYLVETNEGHFPSEGLGTDSAEVVWQASTYATDYARAIAKAYYSAVPTRGYLYGCSGGGMRSSASLEHAPGLFDGGVSQAWGQDPVSGWSVYALAGALLNDQLSRIKDDAEAGGGDIYAGLDAKQTAALGLLRELGYPDQALPQLSNAYFASPWIVYGILDEDPKYFEDFWKRAGYAGHDEPDILNPQLIDQELTVQQVLSVQETLAGGWNSLAPEVLNGDPTGAAQAKPAIRVDWPGDYTKLFMSRVTILSGPDAGKATYVTSMKPGGVVQAFIPRSPWGFNNVKVGDRVRVDNRDWLAFMYYHRYSGQELANRLGLATPRHALVWPQHRLLEKADGSPRYIQRFKKTIDVGVSTGAFDPRSKLITLNGLADDAIWPASQEMYGRVVRNKLGARTDQQFRQWWIERVPHCSGPLTGPRSTTTVPVYGVVTEALRQVVRWVEEGVPATANTSYEFAGKTNVLTLAATADERGGVQPLVYLTANGGPRADVKVGEPVRFEGSASLASGAGTIVRTEFDFDGQGRWPEKADRDLKSPSSITVIHTYDRPGTYFATFRVGSAAPGRAGKETNLIYNLARARVVVR